MLNNGKNHKNSKINTFIHFFYNFIYIKRFNNDYLLCLKNKNILSSINIIKIFLLM